MSDDEIETLLAQLRHQFNGTWNGGIAARVMVREAFAREESRVKAMLADPVALRVNILRHGPAGFDIYSVEHLERIKSEAVAQVEARLNDSLVELQVCRTALANFPEPK